MNDEPAQVEEGGEGAAGGEGRGVVAEAEKCKVDILLVSPLGP